MSLTPSSGNPITFTNLYDGTMNTSPASNSNISASVIMSQSWPKGPSPGDATYPYIGWGGSGSYNIANRLCGAPTQSSNLSLSDFYDLLGTCEGTDFSVFPNYTVQYKLDNIFANSSDTIDDITFSIKDSSLGTTLVSDYQTLLTGPTELIPANPADFILLSTNTTSNVQNCYWTFDFTCNYRNLGTGRAQGYCDANDGLGSQLIFNVSIADATTYNLEYTTTGYAPSASLTGSTGGGFQWSFVFD
jgi:hypothetical protein